MIRRFSLPILTVAFLAFHATVGVSQTAPGTLTNPIKGGATLLHFSRSASDATLAGGRVVYYQCGAAETQMTLNRILTASLTASSCDELPDLKANITGQWSQWIRVTPGANGSKYQGLHAATLNMVDAATGAVLATLDCRGSNGVGTHHAPLAETADACAQPLHFEGSFMGQIVGGNYKGAYLQGTYAGDLATDPVATEQGQQVAITLEGVVLKPCPQRFTGAGVPTLSGALKSLHLPGARP
jgi:hypothetical protein